jgi:hypothetical protein
VLTCLHTLNNPLNFIDPSGHREIGADENDLLPFQPPPTITEQIEQGYNVYGITFSADEGEEWTEHQMTIVLHAAANVDRQLRLAGGFSGYMPGGAFRRMYGSYTMLRSSKTRSFGAETFGPDNKIEFYDPAFEETRDISLKLNAVHEFGHAFNSEVVSRSDGNPYDALDTALHGGPLDGLDVRGGIPDYPWQQSDLDTEGELFADYFLNWVYGSFLSNDAGIGQSSWMNQNMPGWLD